MGGVGRGRRRARSGHARDRYRGADGRSGRRFAQVPHRPRTGFLGDARSPITCASSGWSRRWTACSTGPAPSAGVSSTGWCWRSTANIQAASRRSSARCARATACSKIRAPTRIGSTPSSTKPRNSPSPSRRCAPRRSVRLQAALAARRATRLGVPGGRDRARRLDREADAAASRGRGGGPLSRRAQGEPGARCRRRPHPRRSAPDRPGGHLCAKRHRRSRCLDRRAEGAADRADPRACRT